MALHISKQFDLWLTKADPCMTFDPGNALHFGLVFFLPNLVAIGHFQAIWPLVDPGWTWHDLWPHQCISLWSGVLSTKFGGHRAFLSNLTSGWPGHDLWPQQCITLWSGVLSTKFGGHRALSSNLTSGWPNWPQHDLWPQQCITLWSGVLSTKFGGSRAF